MKKTTKALALVLSLMMLMTAVSITAMADGSAEPDKLTYWRALDTSKETVMYTNWADSEIAKWLNEATNCEVTFVHPPAGQEAEKFNLMIASFDLTDIIERDLSNTANYPGGVDKAVDDGVIITLNEAWDNGLVPNLKAYFDAHPEWLPQLVTDQGNITNFPFIREDDLLLSSWGPQVRIDWLEELGLGFDENNLPSTIDEWDTVLRAFKDSGKVEYPLLCVSLNSMGDNSSLPGAYGVGWEYYLDEEGNVAYGPTQDAFKDFLAQMRTWIADGLMNPDWQANLDTAQLRTNILSDNAAMYFSNLGGGMGTWYDYKNSEQGVTSAPANPEGFRSYALPHPTLEKGAKSRFGGSALHVASFCAFITTACENVEAACRYMDFGYSDEGKEMFNYGKEGVSFNYINYQDMNSPVDLSAFGDKFPRWSDAILANPDHAVAEAASLYIRAHSSGPFPQDEGYLVQFMKYADQLKTIDVWVGSSDFSGSLMPRLYFTTEESEELASLETDIDTYKDETITKFLTGATELNDATWADFQNGLKTMGIEKCLEIRNAAVQRAYERGGM